MATMYFKSTDPQKLAAYEAHNAGKTELKKRCEEFAQQFADDGQRVEVFMGRHGGFWGAKFIPQKPGESWTVPCKDGTQSPRAALKGRGFSKEQKSAHEVLRKRWDEAMPGDCVRTSDLFRQLSGVDHDLVSVAGVMVWDGALYLHAGQMPAPESGWVEILGSEYNAADQARYAAWRAERFGDTGAHKGGAA